MIAYKKASIDDVETLSAMRVAMLCEEGYADPDFQETLFQNTSEYLRKGLSDSSIDLWVAAADDAIIAMCCLNYFWLPPNELCLNGKSAHLGNMYTLPEYRRQGIASKLLELAAAEAKSNQCERLLLVPTEQGAPLYEKFGFQPWFNAMVFFPTRKEQPHA